MTPSVYFENSQPRRLLPIPAGPITDTSRARRSRPVAWNRSLSRRSSSSRPTNGASTVSDRLRPPSSATTRTARQAGTGLVLPLSVCSPASSKTIALSAARCVAAPTRTMPGAAADWRRLAVLTRSPATIPWFVAPSVTAASPVRTPARAWMVGPERSDRIHQLESRPDRALRIVLVCRRRAPDRHDRIADEFLDGPAVAADHVARQIEVAGQQLARVLGVAALGQCREADEVGEQDGHDTALGDRARRVHRGGCRRRPGRRQRLGAVATELLTGLVERAARRAGEGQRSGAFRAELPSGPILGAAVRADQSCLRCDLTVGAYRVSRPFRRPPVFGQERAVDGSGSPSPLTPFLDVLLSGSPWRCGATRPNTRAAGRSWWPCADQRPRSPRDVRPDRRCPGSDPVNSLPECRRTKSRSLSCRSRSSAQKTLQLPPSSLQSISLTLLPPLPLSLVLPTVIYPTSLLSIFSPSTLPPNLTSLLLSSPPSPLSSYQLLSPRGCRGRR